MGGLDVKIRIGALVLVCAALASCNGEGAADTSPPPIPAPAETAPDPTTTVPPVAVPPCGLLTAGEVEEAGGLAVVTVVEEGPITCVFDLGAETGVDIFVSIDDGQGRLAGPEAVFRSYEDLLAAGDAEQVEGLGAAALYAPGFRGLAIDAGDGRFVGLGVNGGFGQLQNPRNLLMALARLALDRL